MTRVLLVFIWFVCFTSTTLAQQASIVGIVTDQVQQAPVEFATVTLHRSPDQAFVTGTTTDAQGKFVLDGLPEGTYRVAVQFLGYQTKTLDSLRLGKNQLLDVGKLHLTATTQLLEEIVVTGQKAAVYHQLDKQVYRASQFQAATGGTASDVLKNLPSVSVDAQGGIAVRGSSGFIVLLNGKPTQVDPPLLLSQIPANAIENIEIITAPSAKYDADGKAGIINITTKTGVTDGISLTVNALGGLPSANDFNNKEKPRRYGADATIYYQYRQCSNGKALIWVSCVAMSSVSPRGEKIFIRLPIISTRKMYF
jgi:outer membrane receptor protein involved in Fe transport